MLNISAATKEEGRLKTFFIRMLMEGHEDEDKDASYGRERERDRKR